MATSEGPAVPDPADEAGPTTPDAPPPRRDSPDDRASGLEARSRQRPTPPTRRLGGLLVLALTAWLLLAKGFLYAPITGPTQDASLRDTAFAVALGVAGVVLTFLGPSRVATGVVLLVGVLMIVTGVLTGPTTARVNDVGVGVLAVLAGVVSLRAARPG